MSLSDQITIDFYRLFVFGTFVFFFLAFLASLHGKLNDKSKESPPFLGLYLTSAGYSLCALIALFPYLSYTGKFDLINTFITLSAAYYCRCMLSYLKFESKIISFFIYSLYLIAGAHFISGVLLNLTNQSFMWINEVLPTKNLILSLSVLTESPSNILKSTTSFHVLGIFICTGLFIKKLFVENRLKSELTILLGLIFNVVLQFNEALIIMLPDAKYIIPLLGLSYVFETIRFFGVQQHQSAKRRLTLEGELVEATLASELSTLAGGVLHDIRNPLTKITLITRSLNKMAENDSDTIEIYRDRMGGIEKAADRMTFIADKYLNILRDTKKPSLEPTELEPLLDEAIQMCEHRINQNKVSKIEAYSNHLSVNANAGALLMCIVNLINNSSDAISRQEDSWIKIRCFEEEKWVKIEIIDSGLGIPEEIAEKIFLKNFSTKLDSGGTGLGLDIVKSLIEKQGGDIIYVENKPNTTFQISLEKAVEKPMSSSTKNLTQAA